MRASCGHFHLIWFTCDEKRQCLTFDYTKVEETDKINAVKGLRRLSLTQELCILSLVHMGG